MPGASYSGIFPESSPVLEPFGNSWVNWFSNCPATCLELIFLRSPKAFPTFLSAFGIQVCVPVLFFHPPWPCGFMSLLKDITIYCFSGVWEGSENR